MKTVAYGFSKESTLLAFEGPVKPKEFNPGSDTLYSQDLINWEQAMSTARESALPVVNPEAVGTMQTYADEESTGLFFFNDPASVKQNLMESNETVALPGWALEKVLQYWNVNDWQTIRSPLTKTDEGVSKLKQEFPDTSYREAYRLKRSEPEKNIPETGELFISESERMKEMKKELIKLTFYSGKLWHSDKPFPVKVFSDTLPVIELFQKEVQVWLSTAYEVVNPEVIPGIIKPQGQLAIMSKSWGSPDMRDGDELTLPEGYGIDDDIDVCELTCEDSRCKLIGCGNPINGDRRIATITMPKPDNSAHAYTTPETDHYNSGWVPDQGGDNIIVNPVVEPSESQEETQDEQWMDVCVETHAIEKIGVSAVIRKLKEKFTITRK